MKYKYYRLRYNYIGIINFHKAVDKTADFLCIPVYFVNLKIFIFYSILNTRNMVKTCDYLYLNMEIHSAKPLKMSDPGAGQKLWNKFRVKLSQIMPLYYPSIYIYI